MSIVYTADVFCDGDDCSKWVHGVSGVRPPGKKEARAEHSVRESWRHLYGMDYCPACVKKMGLGALTKNIKK